MENKEKKEKVKPEIKEQKKIKKKAGELAEALTDVTKEIERKANELKEDEKEICFLQDEKLGLIFHAQSSKYDFFELANAGHNSFDVLLKKRTGKKPSYID